MIALRPRSPLQSLLGPAEHRRPRGSDGLGAVPMRRAVDRYGRQPVKRGNSAAIASGTFKSVVPAGGRAEPLNIRLARDISADANCVWLGSDRVDDGAEADQCERESESFAHCGLLFATGV